MDRIDELLEKYFRAETSLEEEKKLRNYFLSTSVKPEHEMYKSMFGYFASEENIRFPEKEIDFRRTETKAKQNFYLRWVSVAISAAAVMLIAIMFIKPQIEPQKDFAMINGKYIEDEEYVMQVAKSRIENVNGIISRSLKPMENISKVKNSLEPVRKISGLNKK